MNTNQIQRTVLSVISEWVKTQKTPIPQNKIVSIVSFEQTIPHSTIKAAVRVLVKKGYIRKAVTIQRGAAYVQLRSL